jgi:hypothetical protein
MKVLKVDFNTIPELENLLEVSHESVYGTVIKLAFIGT